MIKHGVKFLVLGHLAHQPFMFFVFAFNAKNFIQKGMMVSLLEMLNVRADALILLDSHV